MALKGDLASVDLAQVFQMLALNKKVGLLSILSPRLWKILYFDQRGVTLYYNEHALLERTVAALERAGRLQEAALTEARDHAVQNSGGLMASLLAGGYLTEEELETQMRSELEEETYDLFFCKDARFEFFEGQSEMEGREGTVDQRFFFNTDSIIMEAARRIDEWSYISERIPSPLEVFRAADVAIDAEQVDANCMAVFDLVDGRRNGGRIVEVSGLANFQVFKHLCQLLDGGFIETLPAELLLAAGSQCMVDGRLQDAINLFEKAVGHGLGLPEVHTQAAEAYQAAEEYENAIYHLKCDAEFRIASADNKGAAQKLRAAIRLVPTDLAARERLVELSVGVPDLAGGDFDPQAEGKVLVDLFMAIGDLKRVRGVLERLLRVQPDDMDLKKVLVNVHTKAGDQKRVIELYESMADDLVRGSRPIEAIGCLQKILLLDRSRADISEKVRALYELDERSRSRRRAMALLGAVLCVLLGLGGVWFFYENHAVEMFEKIDAKALLDQNEYAKASGLYQQVIADFPLTTVVERAESELARIESIRKKYEARVANDQATRGKELGAIRADYLAEWNRHKELFMAGQPERSKESLERVQRLLAKAGEQVDLEWAVREQVEKTYTRLRDYLARANELEQRVLELQGKGDWQQARAQGLELLQKYDGTQAARRLRLPVQVSTRPKGAQLVQNGKPLLQKVDGQDEPVRTPAVLFCKSHGDETFAVDLKGFEAQAFVIDARKQPTIDLILKVVAERTIRFPSTVQTGVGIAGDHFVVGLRGGKVGIGRISTGKVTGVLELGGLKAVDTTPIVTGGRAFFLTNEGTIECVLVDKAMLAASWPLKLEHGAITDIAVKEGRVVAIDRDNTVRCHDQGDARQLWLYQLDGPPAGPPTIEKRGVRLATQDGQIVVLDASSGHRVAAWRSPVGICTRVLAQDGVMYFGGSDGSIRAVDESDGRVLWTHPLGRALVDGELVLTAGGLVVLAADQELQQVSLTTGKRRSGQKLGGVLQKGMTATADRILVPLRMARDHNRNAFDLLLALDASDLSVLWEYVDSGPFLGTVGTDGNMALLPDANGEVVLFR